MPNHKSVVRNQGYTRAAVAHIERHNERKNENYGNIDVILEQSHRNAHFKTCNGTYLGVFDEMVKNGEISTRGLKLNNEGTKPESSIIAEMIFDVNTEYFEENYVAHGYANAYDFARAFYAEAYKMAENEVGDEKYILSATLHADERNKGLSEQLGRELYHYHLHVVYIPVVQKEIKWTKRCKDPILVGTVKEVINQVNHSKKWESEKVVDENGKEKLVYSYSKLQDRYHDHMKAMGFHGFDRGKEGSTAQHLSVMEYKAKLRQEELDEKEKALAVTEKALEEKSEKLATTEKNLSAKKKQLSKRENKIGDLEKREAELNETLKGKKLNAEQIQKIHDRVLSDPTRGLFSFGKDKEDNDKLTILRKDWCDIAVTALENSQEIIKLEKLNDTLFEENEQLTEDVKELETDVKAQKQFYIQADKKRRDIHFKHQGLELQIAKIPKEIWERYNPPPQIIPPNIQQQARSTSDHDRS